MGQFDKGSLEANSKITLYRKVEGEESCETFFYLQDLNDDGEIFFNVEYETKHNDGSFEYGIGMENLDVILNAYGFEDYDKLSSYFRAMFENNNDAFNMIIDDIKSKGIDFSVDESEGSESDGGWFCIGN